MSPAPVMWPAPDAGALDLSRLPAFRLVEGDYETDLVALKSRVTARMAARGITFDAVALESEPVTAILEEVCYVRALDRQAMNDAGKSLTLAYAWGAGLDHIAATHYADLGVRRLIVAYDDREAPIYEDDDRFRRRILLAAGYRTPGTLEGYEYVALTAAPQLADVRALNHASGLVQRGQIAVIILPPSGTLQDEAEVLLDRLRDVLFDRRVKLGSDTLFVRLAGEVSYDVAAVLEVRRGPDPALVRLEAMASLQRYAAERRRIGAAVTISGRHAALTVGGVDRVRLLGDVAEVEPAADAVAVLDQLTVAIEVTG